MIRAALNFNPSLLHQAVHGFWWRVTGLRFFMALAAVAIGFAVSILEGDTSWVTGVLGSVLAVGVLFP